jgi:hypothetical protein
MEEQAPHQSVFTSPSARDRQHRTELHRIIRANIRKYTDWTQMWSTMIVTVNILPSSVIHNTLAGIVTQISMRLLLNFCSDKVQYFLYLLMVVLNQAKVTVFAHSRCIQIKENILDQMAKVWVCICNTNENSQICWKCITLVNKYIRKQ